jgi:hypothetical protein
MTPSERWNDETGLFQARPAGVPASVVAIDRDDGTVLYRDGRCLLEIDVGGPATLASPPPGWDARLVAGAATIDLRMGDSADPGATVERHGKLSYAVRRKGDGPGLTFRWLS